MNNKPGHQHVSASAQSASKASCDAPSNPTCSKVSATDLSRSCRGSSSNSVTLLLVVGNSWSMYGRVGSVRAFLLECCSVVSSGLCDGVSRFRRLMSIGAMIAVHRVLFQEDWPGPGSTWIYPRSHPLCRVRNNWSVFPPGRSESQLDIWRWSIRVTCFGHFSSRPVSLAPKRSCDSDLTQAPSYNQEPQLRTFPRVHKARTMAIAPITGVSDIQSFSRQPDLVGPQFGSFRIVTDFFLQMLRRGLVLDLSVAFGKWQEIANTETYLGVFRTCGVTKTVDNERELCRTDDWQLLGLGTSFGYLFWWVECHSIPLSMHSS